MAMTADDKATRTLMLREFDGETLDAMYAAARARNMSLRDYIAALYQLHVGLRKLADDPVVRQDDRGLGAQLTRLLRDLGLLSVHV